MKILISQDMEGVAGVVNGAYGAPRPDEDESRHMMTLEINAAVSGILDANADAEVYVWEAHRFYVEELHEEIKIMRHINPLDAVKIPLDGMMFVGQHAMAGIQKAVLSHTGSSKSIMHMWVNDREFGEMGLCGALAGEHGIPVIFLSGDSAAVKEARDFFGSIETVTTMEAYGNRSAICLTNKKSCRLIRDGTKKAVERITEFKPFKVSPPVEFKIQFKFAEIADKHCLIPNFKRVDATTISYSADNYIDAFRVGYMCLGLVLAQYDR